MASGAVGRDAIVTIRAVNEVERLYTAAESRAFDQRAIAQLHIAGIVLMKRAGRAVFDALRRRWPLASSLTVLCGSGNNAGDGYIVAGIARSHGMAVQLVQLGDAGRLQGDAARARDWAVEQGVTIEAAVEVAPDFVIAGEIVVDALLGTGLVGAVRTEYADAMRIAAAAGRPVIAVDLPSGLCADTGHLDGPVLAADVTVTFICVKRGLVTGAGPGVCGRLEFDDLDVPATLFEGATRTLRWADQYRLLPRRAPTAHKHAAGHVVVVGGDHGMGGAVILAGEAALRVGAGLVSVVTRGAHLAAVHARRPELMVRGADHVDGHVDGEVRALLARASVIAIGPGLGQAPWGRQLLDAAIDAKRPLVMDADALNLCASGALRPGVAVITPHPGEAARLLGCDGTAVQRDRFAAARALARAFAASVVLKGAGSIVDTGTEVSICLHGNPGMATAGMGDVLTGVIAGLLAQGLSPARAAAVGTALHSGAGDVAAARRGRLGLIASDVIEALPVLMYPGGDANAH